MTKEEFQKLTTIFEMSDEDFEKTVGERRSILPRPCIATCSPTRTMNI